jgi:hypothetical protein
MQRTRNQVVSYHRRPQRAADAERSADKHMARKPVLKQFGDLTLADFERHPVWVSVHGLDEGAPWYDDTNEETFRPWTDDLSTLDG